MSLSGGDLGGESDVTSPDELAAVATQQAEEMLSRSGKAHFSQLLSPLDHASDLIIDYQLVLTHLRDVVLFTIHRYGDKQRSL